MVQNIHQFKVGGLTQPLYFKVHSFRLEEEQSQGSNRRTMCFLTNFFKNKNVWFFVIAKLPYESNLCVHTSEPLKQNVKIL